MKIKKISTKDGRESQRINFIFTVYFPLSFSSSVIFSSTMTKTKLLFIRTQGCTYIEYIH